MLVCNYNTYFFNKLSSMTRTLMRGGSPVEVDGEPLAILFSWSFKKICIQFLTLNSLVANESS